MSIQPFKMKTPQLITLMMVSSLFLATFWMLGNRTLSYSDPLQVEENELTLFVENSWIESESSPNPILERVILEVAPIYSINTVNTYRYVKVDLNNDGLAEVVVHLSGNAFCGTGGCTTLIFEQSGNQYQLVSRIPTSHAPIIVLENTSNGWQDLIVYTRDASPTLVEFGEDGYGDKIYIEPSADLVGTYLFAKEYREYQGLDFPLTPDFVPSPTLESP